MTRITLCAAPQCGRSAYGTGEPWLIQCIGWQRITGETDADDTYRCPDHRTDTEYPCAKCAAEGTPEVLSQCAATQATQEAAEAIRTIQQMRKLSRSVVVLHG